LVEYKNYEIYIPQRNSEGYGLNSVLLLLKMCLWMKKGK